MIAKWLATSPRLLILDSPTVGVDIGNKQSIYEDHARRWPTRASAILMISDEIPEVYYNCRPRAAHARGPDRRRLRSAARITEHALEEAVYA